MYGLLSAGLLVGDIIVRPVPKNIMEVDTFAGVESVGYYTGGDALNVATGFAKLGGKAKLVGVIGDDILGRLIVGGCGSAGIDISDVVINDKIPTSTSIVLCEQDGERHFVYSGEANNSLTHDMVSDEAIASCKIVYVGSSMALKGLDGDGLEALFKRAKGQGKITAFDATHDSDGLWLKKIEKALRYTDIFIPSYDEAKMITGETEPEKMAERMAEYFSGGQRDADTAPYKIFGVKLGSRGCYLKGFGRTRLSPTTTDDCKGRCDREDIYIPAFKTDAVDTTGAGDSFMAGFLTEYLRGGTLRECGLFASAVAKFCVESIGATTGIPDRETVLNFLKPQVTALPYQNTQ
jgi:sugar/nucleoside kinase (ribokinase family)